MKGEKLLLFPFPFLQKAFCAAAQKPWEKPWEKCLGKSFSPAFC